MSQNRHLNPPMIASCATATVGSKVSITEMPVNDKVVRKLFEYTQVILSAVEIETYQMQEMSGIFAFIL